MLLVQPRADNREMHGEPLGQDGFRSSSRSNAPGTLRADVNVDAVIAGSLLPGELGGVRNAEAAQAYERTLAARVIV